MVKDNDLMYHILNKIKNSASRKKPIQGKTLCDYFNITRRELKLLITELRKEYPIVSKETNGGGYWVAEDQQDVQDFIDMINRRKQGYLKTIRTMRQYVD